MPVARSYQSLEQIGEPYISNGKQYVNLRFKNGNVKPCRFYTDTEYKKLYGETAVSGQPIKPQKDVLGFEKGYVYIFEPSVGMDEENEYMKASVARFCKLWGWCFISSEPLPDDLPFGYNPIKLPWELVGSSSGYLKSDAEVEKAVGNLFTTNSAITNYPHSIGDRVEIEVKLDKIISFENNYGVGSTFRFIGITDNIPYIWITSAKRDWQIGNVLKIKGTIKDLKDFKGEFQVILNRVNEVVK